MGLRLKSTVNIGEEGIMCNTARMGTIIALCLITLSLIGCGESEPDKAPAAEAKELTIRLAHAVGPSDILALGCDKFKEEVEAKSNGRIKVKIFGNAVLGSDRVTVEAVQNGALDMCASSSPNMANFSKAFFVFDLPYITSPEYQENLYKALDGGELRDYLVDACAKAGVYPLMFFEYGYRKFVATDRDITDLASMQSMKVRTTDSPVEVEVAKRLGMNPTPIAWGEVYTALQQGTVDAEGNTFSLMYSNKHNEVLKSAIDSRHNYSFHIMLIGKKFWEGLNPEDKGILEAAAKEAVAYQRSISVRTEEEALQKFIDGGVKFHKLTPDERAEFVKQTRPVWDQFKDQIPHELLQIVQATQK